jgi:hypothetical protein
MGRPWCRPKVTKLSSLIPSQNLLPDPILVQNALLSEIAGMVRQWGSITIHGKMTWDLLLLCKGLGPVGTIRSDWNVASTDLRGVWDFGPFPCSSCCLSPPGDRLRWISFLVHRCLEDPSRTTYNTKPWQSHKFVAKRSLVHCLNQ